MRTLLSQALLLISLSLFTSFAFADPVWIDVRTPSEYEEDHIQGDLNLPLQKIQTETLISVLENLDPDSEIMLYCRSGNRAGQAKELFEAAGFTNVTNAGGISDVRVLREGAQQRPSQ